MEVVNKDGSVKWVSLIPRRITHPGKFDDVQFEKYYRNDLWELYLNITGYLKNEEASEIWRNISYAKFVKYIYMNSFKTKSNKFY